MTLKDKWNDVCQEYLKIFCDKMGLSFNEAYWPKNQIGTIAVWEDGMSFTMEQIKYIVDNDVNKDLVYKWWDYSYSIEEINLEYDNLTPRTHLPNTTLDMYCKGIRSVSKKQIAKHKECLDKIQKLKQEFVKSIEEKCQEKQ